jgi:predicted nucleotidyltransferase
MTEQFDNTRNRTAVETKHEDLSEFYYLEKKVNVDRAAIREAVEAVGHDKEKVLEYLINTRGL